MQVWIGLVGVAPLPGSSTLGEAKGAYVNALALASTSEEYESAVRSGLRALNLFAFEFEDVEPFAERVANRELEPGLHDLAEAAHHSGQVQFASFHTYANVDA